MYRYIYLYIIIYILSRARASVCVRVRVCARELCENVKVSLGDVMLLKLFLEPLDCRRIKMCAVRRILLV